MLLMIRLLLKTSMKNNKTAYETALHLLRYRSQSSFELWKKLKIRKYNEKEIQNTIEKLKFYGYINDKSLAEDIFCRYKEMNTYGDLYIQRKLKSLGLTFDEHLTFEEELRSAVYFMSHKLSTVPELRRQYSRSASILVHRGFRVEVIKRVLSEFQIQYRYSYKKTEK